jgi:hypothetical protein
MSGLHRNSDDPDEAIKIAKEAEFTALVQQYFQLFGQEPDWWVLGPSEDRARDIREAIRTGKPIVLNIPPDSVA